MNLNKIRIRNAENYIDDNNITKNTYQVEKAFRDGFKSGVEEILKELEAIKGLLK